MLMTSTRNRAPAVTLSEAIVAGAAPDGGLYLPAELPRAPLAPADLAWPAFAPNVLAPFFDDDPLGPVLAQLCASAFDFPVPIVPDPARPGLHILELFHGPTGAFKDFGARFLLRCFERLRPEGGLTVLAATSGDTGGALGASAEGSAAVRAFILYPKGRVSPFQEYQLTCWRAPVRAIEVDGDFDDCQRLVKAAFADRELSAVARLTSANSINIGRLLPQVAYLAWAASAIHAREGVAPGLIIPTGNLGHGFAAVYARALGYPIGPILLVTNANRTLPDWHASGRFEPRASVATIANAMDVGAPSNFERLAALIGDRGEVSVDWVEDDAIRARIRTEHQRGGYVWCPHSAAGAEAYVRLPEAEKTRQPWIAAATAHPYKFADTIVPLIGANIAPSQALAEILGRPTARTTIAPDLAELARALRD